MKMLVVHPGAAWATHDVHLGVVEGLRAHGVAVAEYRLDNRINRTHDFLHYLWRRERRLNPSTTWPKPSAGDVLYQASTGLVERALERGCTDILVVSAMFVLPDRLTLARRAGLRIWLLCTETPYNLAEELRLAALCDGVWTHERSALEEFRQVNARVAYLPHAWRQGCHDVAPSADAVLSCDVLFAGTLFDERVRFLSQIDWRGIDLAILGTTHMLPSRSPLRPFVRGGLISNSDLVQVAKRSKITINLFRACHSHVAESLNPRLYEMAAAGVCSVSDRRPEVVEKFGDAVPVFDDAAGAEVVIRELLQNPDRRAACIHKAQVAVSGDDWMSRALQIIHNILEWQQQPQELSRRSA